MPLTFADITQTKRFEDGGVWIEIRTCLTAHDMDIIEDLMLRQRVPLALNDGEQPMTELLTNVARSNRAMFDLLVEGWSLSDGKPTAAQYDRLDVASRNWVIDCVNEAREIGQQRVEGNGRSPARRKSGRTSSPEEASPSGSTSPKKSRA